MFTHGTNFCIHSFQCQAQTQQKAKLNKPANDNPAADPEKTQEQFEPNVNVILDDPPPQDHETFAEQMENDQTGHAVDPPIPAKSADKPPSLVKAADD